MHHEILVFNQCRRISLCLLPDYDGSDVVLFLDETSQNLRFISGQFSLSNSRHEGKMGIDAMSGFSRITMVVRNNVKPATPFEKMKQNEKCASVGSFIPTLISTCCTRSAQDGTLAMSSKQQKCPGTDRGSFVGTIDIAFTR